jgi:hypothetical protein
MADQWYFEWDNKEFGPFSATQLKELAVLGRLQPGDAVWKEAKSKAVRADRIKNLFRDPAEQLPAQGPGAVPGSMLEPNAASPVAASVLAPNAQQGLEPALESSSILTTVTDLKPKDPVKSHSQAAPPKKPITRGRAIAVKGVVIISQNGEIVQYKKKCTTCGFEEASRRTLPIKPGFTRDGLFCPKCSKRVETLIQCTSS